MCALRDYRKISAVSLASQYRLELKPKRPEPKVLQRKKKSESKTKDKPETSVGKTDGKSDYDYHYLQRMSCIGFDEWEDFDFDGW